MVTGLRNPEELARSVGRFATPSGRHGLYRIGKAWAMIILALVVNWFVRPQGVTLNVSLYLLSTLVIGLGFKGLESCTHEASHYTLFKAKHLNDRLEFLFALPVLEPVEVYRSHHVIHHAKLGRHADPAVQLYLDAGIFEFPRGFIAAMVIRPLIGFCALRFLKETMLTIQNDKVSTLKIAAFWLPALFFVYHAHLVFWFCAYIVVPLLFVFPILLYWGEILDHAGLELSSTLSGARINLGVIATTILYPNGEGYHLVHHLHPGIPGHRLREAYRQLAQNPNFRDSCITCHNILESVRSVRGSI